MVVTGTWRERSAVPRETKDATPRQLTLYPSTTKTATFESETAPNARAPVASDDSADDHDSQRTQSTAIPSIPSVGTIIPIQQFSDVARPIV